MLLFFFLLDNDFSKCSCRIALADAVSGMPFAVLKICGDSPAASLGTVLREKVVLMLHQA